MIDFFQHKFKPRIFLLLVTFCLVISFSNAQVIINEVLLDSGQKLKLEVFNDSEKDASISKIEIKYDSTSFSTNLQDFIIKPFSAGVVEINLPEYRKELWKLYLKVNTENKDFETQYMGCFVAGESIGRYPDIHGDFIVYNPARVSIGASNNFPGILVKRTTKTKYSPRDSSPNASMFYNNQFWIFGGWDYNYDTQTWSSKTNVWKSDDALDWELVNPHPPFDHYCGYVAFNNKMMVFKSDTVLMSTDGVSWEKYRRNPVFYNDCRYVAVGDTLYLFYGNMFGKSTDGINWNIYGTDLPYEEIRQLPAFVYTGTKFMMYAGVGENDVWESLNGLHWTKLLESAPWVPRKWIDYTYFDGKIWLIAGFDPLNEYEPTNYGNLQDFWYSENGVNWTTLETDTAYRNRHASFLWNTGDKVLLSAGFGNILISRMYNDVWELSSKNLFLVAPQNQNKLETSIFPDRISAYHPFNPDSSAFYICSKISGLSDSLLMGYSNKIKLGNSLDTSYILFDSQQGVNLDPLIVSANSGIIFENSSSWLKTPVWSTGSFLKIANFNSPALGFQIESPYHFLLENSNVGILPGSSANKTTFTNSTINTVDNERTIFNTSLLSIDSLNINGNFWIKGIQGNPFLAKKISGKKFPNLMVNTNDFKLEADQILLDSIAVDDNYQLPFQLNISGKFSLILDGGSDFTDKILENFSQRPEFLLIKENSKFTLTKDLDIKNTTLLNFGQLSLENYGLTLNSYSEQHGYIITGGQGFIESGFSKEANGTSLNLTLSDTENAFNQKFVRLKIENPNELDTSGRLKISLGNTQEFLPVTINNTKSETWSKSFVLTPASSFDFGSTISASLLNNDFTNNLDYNRILDNISLRDYLSSNPNGVGFQYRIPVNFSHAQIFSFVRNVYKSNEAPIIFPNPSNGIIKIAGKKNFNLEIYNLKGQFLYSEHIESDNYVVEKDYTSVFKYDGYYFIVLSDLDLNQVNTQKILVDLNN
ncbi:MAG: T9SS type A sorting domain-containing protein [Bacteroidales bacterium]